LKGEKRMKKILSLIITGLLCFSMLSVLAPQVSAQVVTLPWRDDFDYNNLDEMKAAGWAVEGEERIVIGGGVIRLDNDGVESSGVEYMGNFPSGVYDFTVEARSKWVGRAYAQRYFIVWTQRHYYIWYGDGYYPEYSFVRDGVKVLRFEGYSPVINVWATFTLEKRGNTFYMYEDGDLKNTYTETDEAPDELIGVRISAGWISTMEHDYISVEVPCMNAWPMFRHDLLHTGYSTSTAPNTNDTSWIYAAGTEGFSSPAVVGGRVFVGSTIGKVYALDESTATLIWSYDTGSNMWLSSPALANGRVLIGLTNGKVIALNQSTGTLLWSYTTGGYIYASPAVANGRVFIGSNDGKVYALNESTGGLLWSYTTGGRVVSSPAVANGKLFIGSDDRRIYAFQETSGSLVWSYTTGGWIDGSSPAVVGDRVFVGSRDNKVYAFDESTGTLLWSYTTGGDVRSSPAVAYGKVFVGSDDNKVYALNQSTGAPIWSYLTDAIVTTSAPAVADSKVFATTFGNEVLCLDANLGNLIWSYATMNRIETSSPAIANGKVFVGSFDGRIYAFGPPAATVDVDPDTLNLKSQGQWITVYIQLSECLDAIDIDASTLLLNGTISPVLDPQYDFVTNSSEYLVDNIEDGVLERMVKFNRTEVSSWIYDDLGIQFGNVTLTITGELNDGTPFEGADVIFVTIPGDIRGPEFPLGSGLHPPDGVVDGWDYGFIGLAYGKTSSDPDWNVYKIADFRGPAEPDNPPDGVVDGWDYGYCGLQYGKSVYD